MEKFTKRPNGEPHLYCLDCYKQEWEITWQGHKTAFSLEIFNLTKKMKCYYCGKKGMVDFYRVQIANGNYQVRGWCRACYRTGAKNLPFDLFRSHMIDIDALPILQKYEGAKCAVVGCDDYHTELHHFAPRYLFGDSANNWPLHPLCKKHHKEWHEKVTPKMTEGNL